MKFDNIDSKLEEAIQTAVVRYEAEMVERFYTDGDPSLNNMGLWQAQVAAACDELTFRIKVDVEQAFRRVNDDLDEGEYMSSDEVLKELKVQERAREELRHLDSSPIASDAPGIIPLIELCKNPG